MAEDNLATELLHTLKTSIKRLYVILVILIILLFGTNMAWLYAWNLPSEENTTTITHDCDDSGSNNFIGNDGDINGSSSD